MRADRRLADRLFRLAAVVAAAAFVGFLGGGAVRADEAPSMEDASIGELSTAVVQQGLAGDRASSTIDKQKAYRTARDLMRQIARIAGEGEAIRPDQRPEDARAALTDLANSGLTADVIALHDFQWSLAAFGTGAKDSAGAVGQTVDLDALVRDIADPRYRIAAFVDLARIELQRHAEARVRRYAKLATGEAEAVVDGSDRAAGALAVIRLLRDAGPERYAAAVIQAVALMPSAAARAEA